MNKFVLTLLFILSMARAKAQQDVIWNKDILVANLQKETRLLRNMDTDTIQVTDSIKNALAENILVLKSFTDGLMFASHKISNRDSEFVYSLNKDLRGLKNLHLNDYDLTEVLDDLSAKYASLSNMAITSAAPNTDITVQVYTVDTAGNPVRNCTVYWNYWLDYTNTFPRASFTNPTSPSAGYLKPGTYDIWVVKPGSSERFPRQPTKKKIQLTPAGVCDPIWIIVN